MKLTKLRSGRVKLDLSPSKSPIRSPDSISPIPQGKRFLRSATKSKQTSRSSRSSKKLIDELNSSKESPEKIIIKQNKSAQLKSSISDNDTDETSNRSKLSLSGKKRKAKKTKLSPANRQQKTKTPSPSKKVSPKSPMSRSKLRSSKSPVSKASNHHVLKEPVVRLERLSKIVKAKRTSVLSPKIKIFINDELLSDCKVNVSPDILDSIHSPRALENGKTSRTRSLALAESTPKVNRSLLSTTLTIESEQETLKNDTYDLLEPKTPRLRKAILEKEDEKNKTLQSDIKNKTASQSLVKKKGNVQFTSPLSQRNSFMTRSQSIQNKRDKSLMKISPKSSRRNIMKSLINISSLNKSVNGKAPATTNSATPLRFHRSGSFLKTASSSPFASRIKTPDPKSSTKKKMPNFADIHKKKFDKLESISDAVKRVQKRHIALTGLENGDRTGIKATANKVARTNVSSTETKYGYTRFGFKLRKPEATACILRNKIVNPRRSTEQNRAILKGVRTNRRFELQMKMRNLN